MKTFNSIMEAKMEESKGEDDAVERRRRETSKDYFLSKYLRLICICLSVCYPERREVIAAARKFEYSYSVGRLKNKQIEDLPIDYLEQVLGPDQSELPDEEKKSELCRRYRHEFAQERHS